jgi:flagellar biosynthesis chaperone FliJ
MKEKKKKIPRFDASACTTNEEIDKELALISLYKVELNQKKEDIRKSKMSIFQLRKYEHNVDVRLIDLTQ